MRRLIALILMCIVPLQFAWAAAVGVQGHAGKDPLAMGVHVHGHEDMASHGHDLDPNGGTETGHADDGHHVSHYHPTFLSILVPVDLKLASSLSDGPPVHPLAIFLSRTPPLLDRPPLDLA